MGIRGAVAVFCSALVVAAVVMTVLSGGPEPAELPAITLRDPGGRPFDVRELQRRVWVASVVAAPCLEGCEALLERLRALADRLPDGVPLVSFVVDGRSAWPPPPAAARGRAHWTVLQGNDVDAASETEVRQLAVGLLGFDPARLDAMSDGDPAALVVAVDRRGRARRPVAISGATSAAEPLDTVLGEVEFFSSLDQHPLRHAVLNGTSAALLITGLLFIRRRRVREHLTCMGLATLTTLIFLASYLHYHWYAGSVSFRGEGWSRPLYFSILLSHTVLASLVVPLAATALYLAARRQFERHRAIARWTLPIWLYVSVTGVLIYCMLYLWFPGAAPP